MTFLLGFNDAHAWTGEIRFDGLLYHILVQSTVPVHSGVCDQSWQLELLLCLVSLLLWSFVLLLFGSMAVAEFDRERIQEIQKQRRDRLEFILEAVTIQVSNFRVVISSYFRRSWLEPNRLLISLAVNFDSKKINESATRQMWLYKKVDGNEHHDTGSARDSTDSMKERTSSSSSCDICCICLGEFRVGDKVCRSHNCSHVFHLDGCMSEWLMNHDECPLCRSVYVCSPKQSSQATNQIKYVRPMSRFLLPRVAYDEQSQHHSNHHNDASSFQRRVSSRFPEISIIGFTGVSNLPP